MLIILREEIICLIILVFLAFYYFKNKQKDNSNNFFSIILIAVGHVCFDIITVITVNNRDVVPDILNRICHILFYMTGIFFSREFYNYILDLSGLYKRKWLQRLGGNLPIFVFVVLLICMPMEYVEGTGTDYSYGPLAFLGYSFFLIQCTICIIILLLSKHKLEKRVRRAIIPMIIAMELLIITQAIIPEMLMTGGGITVVCIGMFVSMDNPDIDYKKQALWDYLTGLKNQNSYKKDLERYINSTKYNSKKSRLGLFKEYRIGFVVADLNYLKKINDTYGHIEGDRLIAAAGSVLRNNLKNAEAVYRMGGDEFTAIYISPDDDIVTQEIENVFKACEENNEFAVPLSIAIGYASGIVDENINDVIKLADQLMYDNKNELKASGKVIAPVNQG
ncbi:MAG: GGDEF domain-containing protein [Oscillospiraceae bacterium]|nr:GGDEF domain-containing protein [Oscillospiraceae bacterium]